jgi:hypothetical protein
MKRSGIMPKVNWMVACSAEDANRLQRGCDEQVIFSVVKPAFLTYMYPEIVAEICMFLILLKLSP